LARAGVWLLFKGLFALFLKFIYLFIFLASVNLTDSYSEHEPEFDWSIDNKRAARVPRT